MLQRQRRRWKVLFLLLSGLAMAGLRMYVGWDEIAANWRETWNYERPLASASHFYDTIRDADRLVVRDGGFNCCGSVRGQPILFTVTDAAELEGIRQHIRFVPFTNEITGGCLCCGYPGMDWYKGKNRVALTSLQHGHAIRWKRFGSKFSGPFQRYGDVSLTRESAAWVADWLNGHGVTGPKEEGEQRKRRAAIAKEAESMLEAFVPPGLAEVMAIVQQKSPGETSTAVSPARASLKEDELRPPYMRAAFHDEATMYTALFRLLGCLPMHWDCQYPAQNMAYEFLVRAPRDELDRALPAAVRAADPLVRQGAARLIYSQNYMTLFQKSHEDIERWMTLFSAAAYSDPFPENRRLVLYCLREFPAVDAMDVMRQAVEDPDPTVRRRAVEALAVRSGEEARRILRLVADGHATPREPGQELPMDYGEGAMRFHTPGTYAEKFPGTDREAAAAALHAPRP